MARAHAEAAVHCRELLCAGEAAAFGTLVTALLAGRSWRRRFSRLKALDPDYIVPKHCAGEPFFETVMAEIPSKLLRSFIALGSCSTSNRCSLGHHGYRPQPGR